MFTQEARDELRDRVVELAEGDSRVVAAAEVGSLALGEGDRWSDLDLTFAVDDGIAVTEVLDEWTSTLIDMGAVVLFDLSAGPSTYRVYMFPECLQLDLSFTPTSEFRPTSPRFRLLFGEAREMSTPPAADPSELLGWAVMWARHARVCIERGRLRQAEHAIANMRERALDFACLRRDLPAGYGRGLEDLPTSVYERFAVSLGGTPDPDALGRALTSCVSALSSECRDAAEIDDIACDRLSEVVAGI